MVGHVWFRHSDITKSCFEIGFTVLSLQWLVSAIEARLLWCKQR
jgi:hypothetical protein